LFFVAGPCVIESEEHTIRLAGQLSEIFDRLQVPLIFKASFDKANRTSLHSFRGPGLEEGLRILGRVRSEFGLPVLSDIHETWQAAPAAEVLDVVQIPAFLCRQTDLLAAAARTGKPVNVKKGQFLAPEDMAHAVEKLEAAGCRRILLTERGTSLGYHNLVVDFRSLVTMREMGYPVVFDATHSVQLPGGGQGQSSGRSEFIHPLARAAAAVGVGGFFFEVHDAPERAMSDGPNALRLEAVPALVEELCRIDELVQRRGQR